MLDSIQIINFRSCEKVWVRLSDPVVALLGKNGAGKTNVLHAIQLAADMCAGDTDSAFSLSPRDRKKLTSFSLKFNMGSSLYSFQISRSWNPAESEKFEESLEKDGSALFNRRGEALQVAGHRTILRVPTQTGSLHALMQLITPDQPIYSELRPVSQYLGVLQYYPLTQQFQEHAGPPPNPYIETSMYEQWKVLYSQGRPNDTANNRIYDSVNARLLHMHLAAREKFEALKTLLGSDGLGLIDDIRVEEVRSPKSGKAEDPTYTIHFMPSSGIAGAGHLFRYSGLSAGTWRVLRMLTYLIFDEASCMLLEQPEDSIHAGLLAKIVDVFKTYSMRTQLICTTHSPKVVNLVGPKGIRIVTVAEGRTEVAELSPPILEASKAYLADEGSLADFLDTL